MDASRKRETRIEHLSRKFEQEQDVPGRRKNHGPAWPTRQSPVDAMPPHQPEPKLEIDDIPTPDVIGFTDWVHKVDNPADECEGIPVVLEEPGKIALLPPHGQIAVIPEGQRSGRSAEAELLRPVAELRPGSVFAMIEGTHRDLLDEFVDIFIDRPEEQRALSNSWRLPLQIALEAGPVEWRAVQNRLLAHGLKRSEMTYRNWANGITIAPRNYPEVIPLLAKVVGDPVLEKNCDDVVRSIKAIYRARGEAADLLIEEIFSGKIDWVAMRIRTRVGDSEVIVELHRVMSVGVPIPCSRQYLGRVHSIFSIREPMQGAEN